MTLVKKMLRDACNIMYDNYKLFPIVEVLYEQAKTLSEEDRKTYVLLNIELYSGIKYIVSHKLAAIDEIWWQLETSMFEPILKSILKSVLMVYINNSLDKEEIEYLNVIIENY